MAKCMYCKVDLHESSVVDVCQSCGHKVWGEKMFSAIVENMENARETGDLFQGSVTSQENSPIEPNPNQVENQPVETNAQNSSIPDNPRIEIIDGEI